MKFPSWSKSKVSIPQSFQLSYLVEPQNAGWKGDFFNAINGRLVGLAHYDPNGTVLLMGYLSGHAMPHDDQDGMAGLVEVAFSDGLKFETVESGFSSMRGRAGFEMLPASSTVHTGKSSFLGKIAEIKNKFTVDGTRDESIWERFNNFQLNVQSPRNRFYSD